MADRTVEDRLREEYFDLLPTVRNVLEHLEAEIRYRLLPVSRALERFERLELSSRVKECQSAVEALKRHQEGAIFYPDRSYTLTSLKDLAGVRILSFPKRRIADVDAVLRESFPAWTADPVRTDRGETVGLKYWGYCAAASSQICGEYQIVSALTGLFWNVEHSVLYKPAPQWRGVARSITMQQRSQDVMNALAAFEEDFERLIRDGNSH